MVKIQIDLNEKENKIVAIHKAKNDIKTKQQAIKQIIQKHEER